MKRKGLTKRLISVMLAIIMLNAFVPMIQVSADDVDDAIQQRIDDLYSKLGNTYFTADHTGKKCGLWGYGHGCDNCDTEYIVEEEWFKKLFGECSASKFANSYSTGNNYSGRVGQSCFGFANFAEWYIFKSSNKDKITTKHIGTYNLNYENIKKYAKIGDILRFGTSHSAIYISANKKDGVYVLDSNWNGKYQCLVQKHYVYYGYASTFTVCRATNRNSIVPHQHNWKTYKNLPTHPHYTQDRCTVCGEIKTKKNANYDKNCKECNPTPTPAPQPPSAPSINVKPATNFAVGSSITVSWGSVSKATGYDVTLTHSTNSAYNQTVSVGEKATSTSLNINNAGTYAVTVKAKNKAGSSASSNKINIKAYEPSTVTFANYDGTVLTTQKVKYGEAAKAPDSPSREGYTFTGWDKSFSKITANTTITSQYKINTYTVRFIHRDGETAKTEKVNYGSAANPPELPATVSGGYKFSGWDTDGYQEVKQDLTVHAVYVWENDELPIKFTTSPVVRRNEVGSGYNADLKLYNYPEATTDGKIVVVLKTSEGKMVASKTEAISLSAGASAERSVFVPYDGVASTAEVTVVAIIDNDKTGVPISEKAVIDVDLNTVWSDWSVVKPEQSEGLEIEERTEYRYRTKSTTTSSNSTMSGWTLYNTTSTQTAWTTTKTKPASKTGREITSTTVPATYKTQYKFGGYRGKKGSSYWAHFCPTILGNMGYTTPWVETSWMDKDITLTKWSSVQSCSCHGKFKGYYEYNGIHYYYRYTKQVVKTAAYTEYKYRDTNYTYYYYKWNDWNDWSADAVTANDNREVETRTVYRYKSEFSSNMEDNEGESRTLTGHIDNVEDGKQVTLYIFKGTNTDPTESQLEYVGQSTLSDGGNYSFDYITKEEPSEKTGDFIIMVGVEGAIAPFYVDTIKAPVPEYTVEFAVDGEVIGTQTVSEGDTAVVPDVPEKEGYTFVGWDTGVTNVHDNMTINAVYTPNQYSVIFLDWDNKAIDIRTFSYGDVLEAPEEAGEKEGGTFAGWDKILEGETTITGNMIVTATYDLNEYEVTFYDVDGEVISKQTVKYGEAAEVPGDPVLEGYTFNKWNLGVELMSVTDDLNVYPEFRFEETAGEPVFSIYDGETEDTKIVLLSTDDEDAIIYYTTDGTEPYVESSELGIESVNGTVYSEALELSIGTVVQAVAYADGKNTSDTAVCYVEEFYDDTENPDNPTEPDLPSDEMTDITLTLSNLSANGDYVTADIINNGEVTANAVVFVAAYGSSGELLKVDMQNIENMEPDTSQNISVSNAEGAAYYKVFAWYNIKTMFPVSNVLSSDE